MNERYGELYYSGFTGKLKSITNQSGKIMFSPDANLVLNLRKSSTTYSSLPNSYKEYLRVTRSKAYKSWKVREKWIPIDPTLAIMELTHQDRTKNFPEYLNYFNDFFEKNYKINNFHPDWVYETYSYAYRSLVATHSSIQKNIEATYPLLNLNKKISKKETLSGVDKYIRWIKSEKDNLGMIGGLPLYVSIYAIAGSPDAHEFLKASQAKRQGYQNISKNIGWDFLYWLSSDMNYYANAYKNYIICTGDKVLAKALGSRIHKGERYSYEEMYKMKSINSEGNIKPFFKLSKLDNTDLEKEIYGKVINLFQCLDIYPDKDLVR